MIRKIVCKILIHATSENQLTARVTLFSHAFSQQLLDIFQEYSIEQIIRIRIRIDLIIVIINEKRMIGNRI